MVPLVRSLDGPVFVTGELRLGGFDGPLARWTGSSGSVGALPVSLITDPAADRDVESGRATLKAEPGLWMGLAVVAGSAESPDLDTLRNGLDEGNRTVRTGHLRRSSRANSSLALPCPSRPGQWKSAVFWTSGGARQT